MTEQGHEHDETSGFTDLSEIYKEELIPPATSTPHAAVDAFMHTLEFRRHFVEFVPNDTLMTLRLTTKGWKAAADAFVDEGVKSSEMIVHGGKDTTHDLGDGVEERRKHVSS